MQVAQQKTIMKSNAGEVRIKNMLSSHMKSTPTLAHWKSMRRILVPGLKVGTNPGTGNLMTTSDLGGVHPHVCVSEPCG
jgi:hypothetical protein